MSANGLSTTRPRAARDTGPEQPVIVRLARPAAVDGAPRVLMLHGLASGSYIWTEFLTRATPRWELWTADLPWRGDSYAGWSREGDDVSRWVYDAIAMLPEPPDVVIAHSFSTNALLQALTEEPNGRWRPHGVVLVSPFYRPHPEDFDWRTISYFLNDFHRILAEGIRVRSGDRLAPDIQTEMAEHVREFVGPYGWVRFFDTYLNTPRLKLAHVTEPCLVVAGAEDVAAFPRDAEALAAGLPNARLRVLSGCGHFAMAERANEFAADVNALLDDLFRNIRTDPTVSSPHLEKSL